MNKESSSRKRRHHKEREPAADEETLFNLINELRKQCGLQEIKTQPGIKEYASMLINNFEEANLENEAYVIMSNLSFSDEFDNQKQYCDSISFYNPNHYDYIPNDLYYDFSPFKVNSIRCQSNTKCARTRDQLSSPFSATCLPFSCSSDNTYYNLSVNGNNVKCTKYNEILTVGDVSIQCEDPLAYCSIDKYYSNFKSVFLNDDSPVKNKGLSTGAIVGIAAGSAAGGCGIIAAVLYFILGRRSANDESQEAKNDTLKKDILP